MPQTRTPRRGSLQFWPRKRSRRVYARVRSWPAAQEAKLLGFAGYKVGMTHLIVNDNRKASTTKGMETSYPATIVECPPLKAASIRFYKKSPGGAKVVSETLAESLDKELGRKISIPKKKGRKQIPADYDYIHLLVYTQPKLTGNGKKKPEVFEIAVGGNAEDQLKYAHEKLGKDIPVNEVFKEGQLVDVHAVTKGKGVQGPVKRFGVNLRNHKSEKGVRRVGSLGGWIAQGHIMWRNAKAGKMGYHTRTEYNKWVLKIGGAKDINRKGGFAHYGLVKNNYVLLKGSIGGPQKRIVRFNEPMRPAKNIPQEAPAIKHINVQVLK